MIWTIWTLGITAIISSVIVISAKNPIHSVLALVMTYFAACGIMVLVKVEFLALLFMIVYVGAIAILFLFVVMMLNIKLEELKDNATRYVPLGLIIGLVFLIEILLVLGKENSAGVPGINLGSDSAAIPYEAFSYIGGTNYTNKYNIEVVGSILYTDLFIWMIIASIILLVAMIGAIVYANMFGGLGAPAPGKRQDIFGQIGTKPAIWLASAKLEASLT